MSEDNSKPYWIYETTVQKNDRLVLSKKMLRSKAFVSLTGAAKQLEPTCSKQQDAENKELTEHANSVFATGLDKIVQACSELAESDYPELEHIITAWPELPETVKRSILKLVQDAASR